jgi:hypothetical protein
MQGDHWTLDDEVGMLGHLFDPEFSGRAPADSIDINFRILSQEEPEPGMHELRAIASILVFVGHGGFYLDTMLTFRIVEQADGLARIHQIREDPFFAARAVPDPGPWSHLKARYR